MVRVPPPKSNLSLFVVLSNPIIIPVCPCRKPDEAMGWNQWKKVSASCHGPEGLEDTEDTVGTEDVEDVERGGRGGHGGRGDKKEATLMIL